MQIVGPQVELRHVRRIEGEETADGREIIWAGPVRFKGVMAQLTGKEVLTYQQMKVNARYKVLTNYLYIAEKDRVTRGSITYDVKLVDNTLMMNKLHVILLDTFK